MIDDRIHFLHNARQIKYGDMTTAENFFLNEKNPVIVVMDLNNILSNNEVGKMSVVFKNAYKSVNILVNYGTTVEQLIKMYLYKVCGKELIDDYYTGKKVIKFLFNAKDIKFGEQTSVEQYFRSCYYPQVTVLEMRNC